MMCPDSALRREVLRWVGVILRALDLVGVIVGLNSFVYRALQNGEGPR
jgi:hypothetical protein